MITAEVPRIRSKLFVSPLNEEPESLKKNGATMDDLEPRMPRVVRITMILCSVVAITASSYLAWASLTSSPVAGCGGGNVFDCDSVLHSQWSSVGSVPISIPAIATHLVIISSLLVRPASFYWNQLRVAMLGFACLTTAFAAVWFIGLQVFWIHHLCQYCLVAHLAGITLAVLFFLYQPIERKKFNRIIGLSAASVALLITLQFQNTAPLTYEVIEYPEQGDDAIAPEEQATLFESPDMLEQPQATSLDGASSEMNDEYLDKLAVKLNWKLYQLSFPSMSLSLLTEDTNSTVPPRLVTILNDIQLKSKAWPIIGDPEAELIFVELFDYTCSHCQQTHIAIEAAQKKLGGRLAVLTLPVPLDAKCNSTVRSTQPMHAQACELAKLSLAVWLTDKKQFEEFHNYLFASKPSKDQALAKAKSMVDPVKFESVLNGPLPASYIAKHVELYKKSGAGTIPKLLFPRSTSSGAITSPEAIVKLTETRMK